MSLLYLTILFGSAQATIWQVGPGRQYTAPSQVANIISDGDTVDIDAGLYAADVAVWTRDNLLIRSVGGIAHLRADGENAQGKGIWVIKGSNTTVENIEFSGATVPDQNGAGIRQEGSGLTVRYCYFHDNENGILGPDGTGDVLIEYSEFANNGFGDGFTHNMYILNAASFTLQHCYIHHAKIGHNVKSRAQENYILYNRIMDEDTGTSSYAVDLPNGGKSYIIGNLIQQGPDNDNSTIISYGAEGLSNPANELYVVNNTIVNDYSGGTFVYIQNGRDAAKLMNNLLVGPGNIVSGSADLDSNLDTDTPKLVDRTNYDYHLTSASSAIDAGMAPGSINGFSLLPIWQYVYDADKEARTSVNTIDIGAYEFSDATVSVEFMNFSADISGNAVSLSWQTASENGNLGYDIERKAGNGDFLVVGFVRGYGTTSNVQAYHFVDSDLPSGQYQYRLQQIALDGSSQYSSVVEVNIGPPQEFELLQNYPNPFNPATTIRFSLAVGGFVTLKILNLRGQEIATLLHEHLAPGNHETTWHAGDQASGIYFYILNMKNLHLQKKLLLLK